MKRRYVLTADQSDAASAAVTARGLGGGHEGLPGLLGQGLKLPAGGEGGDVFLVAECDHGVGEVARQLAHGVAVARVALGHGVGERLRERVEPRVLLEVQLQLANLRHRRNPKKSTNYHI
eukprot:1180696-Prorocentrum_minimum.AAC.3